MACFSSAHSPRSISLHRSLQKGLKADVLSHATGRWQVGQLTVLIVILELANTQGEVNIRLCLTRSF